MAVALAEVVLNTRKSPESAEIGERLRALRNERGLTAREVALGMGLGSPESYRQYEKGHIRHWATVIPRLARGVTSTAGVTSRLHFTTLARGLRHRKAPSRLLGRGLL